MNKTAITFQRLEGFAIFVAATYFYFQSGFNLWLYLVGSFAIDISMIGYLVNNKLGAHVYNLGHSYIMPSLLAIAALVSGNAFITGLACIWFSHIGIDRALGYGLKLSNGFKHTHLGDIGGR